MKALIVGAAGMVGRKLVARLVRDGASAGARSTMRISSTSSRLRRQRARRSRSRSTPTTSLPPMPRRSSSRRGPTSSSCSPRSSRARRKRISRKGYGINLDGTRSVFEAIRREQALSGGAYRAAPRLHLVDRRLRLALPRQDRRRILRDAADELRDAEGDLRASARRLLPPRLFRWDRRSGSRPSACVPARPTRRRPASSPTSSASRWPARRRSCRWTTPCATGTPRRGRRSGSCCARRNRTRTCSGAAHPEPAGRQRHRRRADRGAAANRGGEDRCAHPPRPRRDDRRDRRRLAPQLRPRQGKGARVQGGR